MDTACRVSIRVRARVRARAWIKVRVWFRARVGLGLELGFRLGLRLGSGLGLGLGLGLRSGLPRLHTESEGRGGRGGIYHPLSGTLNGGRGNILVASQRDVYIEQRGAVQHLALGLGGRLG